MTVATNANVTKLYIATFDRAPDGAGLSYWVNNSGLSLEQIAQSFFDQPETQTKYAGVDTETFVKTIYQNVLGREGEPAGVAYWVGELNAGHISKDTAILAVINGALGTDAALLENKTEVGIYFAEHNQDNDPDAFAVMDETKLDQTSVELCKQWIDGDLPQDATPSTYHVLDDSRADYNITGSDKGDVFVVEAFKSATIHGKEGSDTLDFQDFTPKGVSVNLSTGLGPVGSAGTAMTFDWIENVRGTSGNDTLIGNSDANILVSMGGADTIDGGVGDDRILFRTMADIKASTINGGQNTDTLEITNETSISVATGDFNKVSDVEILQVGYSDEGVPSAATITMADATATFGTIQEVHGTTSYDKKGNPTNDVIQSAFNLDVSGVKLVSIEELKSTADVNAANGSTITVGPATLASVQKVTGNSTGKTDVVLKAKDGDVVDLTVPTFTNIDTFTQAAAAASTLIVNQSLINSMASNDGIDGFSKINSVVVPISTDAANASGNFGSSTLRASGIGLDLSALADGDPNFKAIEFGTAHEVTIGNINDGAPSANDLTNLKTITGSENNADLLRVKPQSGMVLVEDLSGVTITKVERLDFEEIGVVKLNKLDSSVTQISGDDDKRYGNAAITPIMVDLAGNAYGTHILNGTGTSTLDLSNVKLQNIGGFASQTKSADLVGAAATNYLINSKTTWDSNLQSLNGYAGGDKVQSNVGEVDTKVTITAADAGAYDFSSIKLAESAIVDFKADGTPILTYYDKFVGSNGNDIVKGGVASFGYQLGKGDDTFIGTNEANEVVEGGDGNDTIALGDNNDTGSWAAPALNIANLVKSTSLPTTSDYVALANVAAGGALNNAALFAAGNGAFADGGAGDDVITSGKGDDILLGGAGNDRLSGGDGRDVLVAGIGDDILSGGKGEDFLAGGAGDDLLEGNEGEDYLFGGKGRDVLRGDQTKADGVSPDYLAKDHFIFEAGDSGSTEQTVDIIKDFLGTDLAKTLDLDGNGVKGDEGRNDVIYLNWFAATSTVGAGGAIANAADATGGAANANVSGTAYSTFAADIGNTVASQASLVDAANAALDKAYTTLDLATKLGATTYTSEAVQFEYGGKEYVVIDAYVTNAGTATNNYSATNDLIVEVSDSTVSWSISADDIVVTRWNPPVL